MGRERSEQGEDSEDRAREGRAISGGHGRQKTGWNRDRTHGGTGRGRRCGEIRDTVLRKGQKKSEKAG